MADHNTRVIANLAAVLGNDIPTPSDGQHLAWSAAQNRWLPQTPSGVPGGSNLVGGGGSEHFVSVWDGPASVIGGSHLVFQRGASFGLGIGTSNPREQLSLASNKFQISSAGNLQTIKNVAYDWPSLAGGASTFLRLTQSGVLDWATPLSGTAKITVDSVAPTAPAVGDIWISTA